MMVHLQTGSIHRVQIFQFLLQLAEAAFEDLNDDSFILEEHLLTRGAIKIYMTKE